MIDHVTTKVIRKPSVSHFNLITKEWMRVECDSTVQAKSRYVALRRFMTGNHVRVDYGQVSIVSVR